MNDQVIKDYLKDTMYLLKESAREAKLKAKSTEGNEDHQFYLGQRMAYYEIITLLQDQANAFNIPLDVLGIADINPDSDVL